MKKLIILFLLIPFLGISQVYDSAGFVKVRPQYIYVVNYDTVTVVKRDTVITTRVDTVTVIRRDTIVVTRIDTVFVGQPPVDPPPPASGSFTFSATQKSFDNVAIPGGKLESWSEQWIASPGYPKTDGYFRFSWSMLEGAQGQYLFDQAFKTQAEMVFARGGRFGFGIMTHYPDAVSPHRLNYDGGYSVYPQYLHTLMQAESVKDWKAANGAWVPNWNSEAYLSRLLALHQALDAYIKSKGWQDRIAYVDVRGYGAFGEWHSYTIADNMSQYPTGTRATEASLKRIIDAHVQGFPDYPLVTLVSTFDANRLGNTMNPIGVAYHALTVRNNWGLLGWRRDNWGATDDYIRMYTTGNTYTVNGMRLDTAIVNRWKYAPVVGEPCCADANNYGSMLSQVQAVNATNLGNGNIYSLNDTKRANLIAAGNAIGSRLTIDSAWLNDGVLSIRWNNLGNVPLYEKFNVTVKVGATSFTAPLVQVMPGRTVQTIPVSGVGDVVVSVANNFRSYPLGIVGGKIGVVR